MGTTGLDGLPSPGANKENQKPTPFQNELFGGNDALNKPNKGLDGQNDPGIGKGTFLVAFPGDGGEKGEKENPEKKDGQPGKGDKGDPKAKGDPDKSGEGKQDEGANDKGDKAAPQAELKAAPPVDKSARYVPPDLPARVDELIKKESNNVKKDLLERLKTEKSNAKRIEILQTLIQGKEDPESRREIIAPESSPEKKQVYEQLLRNEREIERRYKIIRESVMKTLPDYRDFFLTGEKDQSRQSIYMSLIREDGKASRDRLSELLGLEENKDRQKKIDGLLNDRGDLDRVKILKELRESETDVRKKQLLDQIIKHEEKIKLFGSMIDQRPTDETINKIKELFKDENEAKRLKAIQTSTEAVRTGMIDQMIARTNNKDLKTELEKLKKEEKPEERQKIIEKLLSNTEAGIPRGKLAQLLDVERKLSILSDLPKEEQTRKDTFQSLDKAATGDYDSVMKCYTLCAQWLQYSVPDTFVEMGYYMGLPIPPGCPMKLPTERFGRKEGTPIPPELMKMYVKDGLIRFNMEQSAERLLNPAEKEDNVATLINSVEWLYGCKKEIREKNLRFVADQKVKELQAYYGEDGVKKYGPDGIPKGFMPPENVDAIPAWIAKINDVENLGNRLRNYAQALKTLDSIENSDKALEELKALGVQFEFGKNNELTSFVIPDLDGLDLRDKIPNVKKITDKYEKWLASHHQQVDKLLEPYKEAAAKLRESKDPKAFLRFGDFPRTEGVHPDIGVPYDVVKHRVNNVKIEGGKVIIEGTIQYQTAEWYSYNYWVGCDDVSKNMSMDDFRKTNGLANDAQPKEGEKYKIKGDDGKAYDGWTYKGKNPDGTLKFERGETFRIEKSLTDYIPCMTAMGSIQMVAGNDINRWLYGAKMDSINPSKWELPQVGFWHHGLKFGKLGMDIGLTVSGFYGGFIAEGASWGARAMSFGRLGVGLAGGLHAGIDKLPKPWRDGIHLATHAFILADVGLGLGVSTFKKAFGIGAAAKESASLLSTLGHGAMAVDGIAIYGPVVANEIKGTIDNHFGWTTETALNRALDERGTPERLINQDAGEKKAVKFDLKDKQVRESMEVLVDRLGKTVLTETSDPKIKERVQALVEEGKRVMALDRNDPKRKQFIEKLSKIFSPSDESILWDEISKNPSKYEKSFRDEMQAKAGAAGGEASSQEKLVAASLALILQADDKGQVPQDLMSRKVTMPEHREREGKQLKTVGSSQIDVTVQRNDVYNFIQSLAESSDSPSLRMGAAKLMWRVGKPDENGQTRQWLDNNGLAGVLIDVVKKSNNRDLVGMALIDTKDVSLGYLLNDIMHDEVRAGNMGYVALEQYRKDNYLLTADVLKNELKSVLKDPNRSADVRALAMEVLLANDLDKVRDRKQALEECERRWEKNKDKEGEYASDLIKELRFRAKQDIPDTNRDRKIKVVENGQEKEKTITLTPDDVRLERFSALEALKQIGTIKVDGENYKMPAEELNANLIKCLSRQNIDLSVAVIADLDLSKLDKGQRRELLNVLGWPNSVEVQKVKVDILNKIKDIVGDDRELAAEIKRNLLDMLNPGNRPKSGATDGDYSFVGSYPDLHAATITALASFGCQYSYSPSQRVPMTAAEFKAKLAPGESEELQLGKYYKLKDGDSLVWYRYMGPNGDGKERFIKQGDPTVATMVQHIKDSAAGNIGSAKVRLAVAQAAGDLQIPGLRELMAGWQDKELDVRVAQRVRAIKFPEEPPLDPTSPESIAKLQQNIEDIRKKNQFTNLESYGDWLKGQDKFKALFSYDKDRRDAIHGVYGDSFFSGVPWAYDSVKGWFGGKTPDKYWDEAEAKVDEGYKNALKELIKQAGDSTDRDAQTNAVMALLWLIVRDASDVSKVWKGYTRDMACYAFFDLSKQGCKVRNSAVKHAVEHMLMHQPDLDPPEMKMVFLAAAINMLKADKDNKDQNDQGMSKEELAKVCYAAYKAQNGWPDRAKEPKKYEQELKFRKALLDTLAYECKDNSAVELIEAISVADEKSDEIREHCNELVRWRRDGVLRNIVEAREAPDRTSSAEERRDAILTNLGDPNRSTEDCVRAITKAVEGYDWQKPGNEAKDEMMRSALRKALDDPRVRVQMIASRYLLYFGDAVDLVRSVETLHGITQTPYKYGDSDRSLKYYKLEAQVFLDANDRSLNELAKKDKGTADRLKELVERGKKIYSDKQNGVMAYAFMLPEPGKTLESAQQDLNALLKDPNASETDLIKAIFKAEKTHSRRLLGPNETILDTYRQALEHKSEKVRLAASVVLARATSSPKDIERIISVVRPIEKNGATALMKKEASDVLNLIATLGNFDASGLIGARSAGSLSVDRNKTIASTSAALAAVLKPEQVGVLTRDIFSLASADGKFKADDPALPVLRNALKSRYISVSMAAAMLLAEQSPQPSDVQAAVMTLTDVRLSNAPELFRRDAEAFLKTLRESDRDKAKIIDQVDQLAEKSLGFITDTLKGIQPTSSKDLNANAVKLAEAVRKASQTPKPSTSDDAVKALMIYGSADGALAKDSPVLKIIREAAINHSDERVRLAAAWVLALNAQSINDESTGYMVLARLVESSENKTVRIEANSFLESRKSAYEKILDDKDATDTQKSVAQWAISDIERQREQARKAAAAR